MHRCNFMLWGHPWEAGSCLGCPLIDRLGTREGSRSLFICWDEGSGQPLWVSA